MERETEIEPGSSFHYLGGESSKGEQKECALLSFFFFTLSTHTVALWFHGLDNIHYITAARTQITTI